MPDLFIVSVDEAPLPSPLDVSLLPRVDIFPLPEYDHSWVACETLSQIWTQRAPSCKQGAPLAAKSEGGSYDIVAKAQVPLGCSTIDFEAVDPQNFRRQLPHGVKLTHANLGTQAHRRLLDDLCGAYNAETREHSGQSAHLRSLIGTSIAEFAAKARQWPDGSDNKDSSTPQADKEAFLSEWHQHCQLQSDFVCTLNDLLRPDYLNTNNLSTVVKEALPTRFAHVAYACERETLSDVRSITTCFETGPGYVGTEKYETLRSAKICRVRPVGRHAEYDDSAASAWTSSIEMSGPVRRFELSPGQWSLYVQLASK